MNKENLNPKNFMFFQDSIIKEFLFTKTIKRIMKNDLTLFYFKDANDNYILFDGHHRYYFLLKFLPERFKNIKFKEVKIFTWIAKTFSIKLDEKAFKNLRIISILEAKKAQSLSQSFWLGKIFIKIKRKFLLVIYLFKNKKNHKEEHYEGNRDYRWRTNGRGSY